MCVRNACYTAYCNLQSLSNRVVAWGRTAARPQTRERVATIFSSNPSAASFSSLVSSAVLAAFVVGVLNADHTHRMSPSIWLPRYRLGLPGLRLSIQGRRSMALLMQCRTHPIHMCPSWYWILGTESIELSRLCVFPPERRDGTDKQTRPRLGFLVVRLGWHPTALAASYKPFPQVASRSRYPSTL